MKTRNEQLKQIDRAFWKLERACESTHDWDKYLILIQDEERGHRKFCPEHIRCGLTRAQAVRLFAVKTIFERFVPAHSSEKLFTPEAKDYFCIRGSVFGACAIVDIRREEITKAFTLEEMAAWLAEVDYVELNKDPRQQKEQVAA